MPQAARGQAGRLPRQGAAASVRVRSLRRKGRFPGVEAIRSPYACCCSEAPRRSFFRTLWGKQNRFAFQREIPDLLYLFRRRQPVSLTFAKANGMKTNTAWLLLVFFLGACAVRPVGNLTTPAAPVPMTTPSPSPETDLTEIQCPLAPSPIDLSGNLTRLYRGGRCLLRFQPAAEPSLPAALLPYPSGWRVSVANQAGTALLFELDGRVFFVQFYASDLPLERADEVSATFESIVEPAVHPEEIVKERSLIEVRDKSVLLLTTVLSEQSIRRYFWKEAPAGKAPVIVLFQVTVSAPNLDNSLLIPIVEAMIGALQLEP